MSSNSSSKDVDEVVNKQLVFWDAVDLTLIDGFWHDTHLVDSIDAFRANFWPIRNDVMVLASSPKTGTTWLKALTYSIISRDLGEEEDDLLKKMNPHSCIRNLEADVYFGDSATRPPTIDPDRRLYHTHIPYSQLPEWVKNDSGSCKLVYITRCPKDTLVSMWHFYNKILGPIPLESAVECFCNGKMPFGPFHEHVLEYWEASKRTPEKVMFAKYEDLRHNPKPHVRRLASFMGRPFGDDDDDDKVDKVIWRSSFDRLKGLEVNKSGQLYPVMAPNLVNSDFFRRGEIGDWRNHLTKEMAERVDRVTQVKFRGTGLYMGNAEAK